MPYFLSFSEYSQIDKGYVALFNTRRTWGPLKLLVVSADSMVQKEIYIRVLAREFLPHHFGSKGGLIRGSKFAVCGRMVWAERHIISVKMAVNNVLPHE